MDKTYGKYQVKKELGRGAMGIVYLAFDPVLERDVAVKTVSTTIREERIKERFIREARAAGKLRHPNVVTIYDFGVEKEQLYIAMEYLPGMDLYQLIAEKIPMDITRKLDMVRQICEGLDYAHRHDVFHRDIKPANVRLLDDGTVKLVDFGLAVMQSSSLTQTGAFLGTPSYVSPERLTGESGDGRSDQFGVGILLYELLTCGRAFEGDTISTVIFKVLNSEPKQMAPGFTARFPKVEAVIKKAISKNPDRRFRTMKEMADAVGAVISEMKQAGFAKMDPVGTVDERMTPLSGEPDGHFQEHLDTALVEARKKRRVWPAAAAVGLMAALALIYFFMFGPGSPGPGPAAAPGYLVFDVKPYAEIRGLTNVTTGEKIQPAVEEDRITPVRLKLAPGTYEINYSHPGWDGVIRGREVIINSGRTTYEKDVSHQGFVAEAVKRFSLPRPGGTAKGDQ